MVRLSFLKRVLFLLIVLVLLVGLVEVVLSLTVSAEPQCEQAIAEAISCLERLFSPGKQSSYDVRGLYEGAARVTLRVSADRLIEPQPDDPNARRVLFLGGSTTEALYVPENRRWVALLNEPGKLAAYNAGMSGTNTIDEYYTLLYLTRERKLRFDLVVLMTAANDFGWQKQLGDVGGQLAIKDYQEHLAAWCRTQHAAKPLTVWDALTDYSRIAYLIDRKLVRLIKRKSSLLEVYEEEIRQAQQEACGRTISLATYPRYQQDLRDFERNTAENLAALAREVSASGSRLLVLSEASNYGAPPESFLVDLRRTLEYPDGLASRADMAEHMRTVNRIHLQAARNAGAMTYDLAEAIGEMANGPQGGKHMYDGTHYTPTGCHEVARILKPVVLRVLDGRSP